MPKALVALLAAMVVATPSLVSPGRADDDDDKKKKGKRPGLYLRATPRFSFSPASVMFTAELRGGDDVEELYCPEVEWEWGDGGKSVNEGDCDPWEPGMKIDRRYTNRHEYRRAGNYRIRVNISKSGKRIMSETVQITVRAGAGDPSLQY